MTQLGQEDTKTPLVITFKKRSFAPLLTLGALLVSATDARPAMAQTAAPNVVPGRSLGKVSLGFTPTQVRRVLGKPDKTLRLRNGLLDDIYLAKKTRLRDGELVRDKLEVLYRQGRVVQIEATSPTFATKGGLSSGTSFSDWSAAVRTGVCWFTVTNMVKARGRTST